MRVASGAMSVRAFAVARAFGAAHFFIKKSKRKPYGERPRTWRIYRTENEMPNIGRC